MESIFSMSKYMGNCWKGLQMGVCKKSALVDNELEGTQDARGGTDAK